MKPQPPTSPVQDDSSAGARAWLSALADGAADAADPACRGWRDDAAARQAWHAYHLIGDVMRSEELARPAARDAAFLAGVRSRMLAEPAVLAPLPLSRPAAAHRRQPWLVPAAAAAGFAVVAGVLVVSRLAQPGWAPAGSPPAAAVMASASGPATAVVSGAGLAQMPAQERVVRDARLDEYLRAHQAARGGVAMAAPAGLLRRVDVVVPARAER